MNTIEGCSALVCSAILMLACANGETPCRVGSIQAGRLTLCNAVAPAPVAAGELPSQTMSVYVEIDNASDAADTLLSATSEVAGLVTLHNTMSHDGHAKMMAASTIPIPARSSVQIAPGGIHVMLEQLRRGLQTGDSLSVRLQFAKAGAVSIPVRVVTYQTLDAELARGRKP